MYNYLELLPCDSHKSFYGKARVRVDGDGGYTLISYTTAVARITPDRKLERLWYGWSATTGRHIAAFCQTYGIPYGGKKDWDKL